MADNFTLLIAEPDSDQQKTIQDVLKQEFNISQVLITSTSIDAMGFLNKHDNIRCAIISTHLSDSDGFALAQDIRSIKKYAGLPILMTSDSRERNFLLKAASSGASDFISKPYHAKALKLKLKKLIADQLFRKTPRISTLGAFDIELAFNSDAIYKAKLIEISSGGCSIQSELYRHGGCVFDNVIINIKGDEYSFSLEAELARIERDPETEDHLEKKLIAGFQFKNVDSNQREQIEQFIQVLSQ